MTDKNRELVPDSWIKAHKRLKERYLSGQKHNMHIVGVISFVKLQNDTQIIFFMLCFCPNK